MLTGAERLAVSGPWRWTVRAPDDDQVVRLGEVDGAGSGDPAP